MTYGFEFRTSEKVEREDRVYHYPEFYVNGELVVKGRDGYFDKDLAIKELRENNTVSLILELIAQVGMTHTSGNEQVFLVRLYKYVDGYKRLKARGFLKMDHSEPVSLAEATCHSTPASAFGAAQCSLIKEYTPVIETKTLTEVYNARLNQMAKKHREAKENT